jgi:hypothetical protein
MFGCDASCIIGGFGSGGGSLVMTLCQGRQVECAEGRMLCEEVFVDVCHQLGQISSSEAKMREIWRKITGTSKAKSHSALHMHHKHGTDNQLGAALHAWLLEEHTDVAGNANRNYAGAGVC